MHRLIAFTVTLMFLSVATLTTPQGGPGLQMLGGSPDQESAIAWAVGRFERAGLISPTVTITFHTGRQGCDGHPGLFRDKPAPHIDLCDMSAATTVGKKTLLHEMSHAWAHQFLSLEEIEGFLALRGLTVWADGETSWELQGSEHAAEIMSWALFDRELDLVTIRDADRASVVAAYQALTGGRSLPGR